ncbi:MAG TPA: branched-chain amino acid ABC transporter substrate-binding protein, partial [Marinobacter hydrocarbonoclasticus]|nr:branched-chain amino acid ABC transporter substrate-binding protein [Marinobacter nauticus]
MRPRNALIFATVLLLSSTTVLADTLKIGLNYPQTGRYKDQGLQQRLGAYLA